MRKRKFLAGIVIFIALFGGVLIDKSYSYNWGDDWKFNKCSKCGKWYKHVGEDLSAKAGKKVTFTEDCKFRSKGYDGTWKGWIVVESKNGSWTYVVWHLSDIPNFKKGDSVKGKRIGNVADMGSNTHIHIGFRDSSYSDLYSMKGALPACDHKPGGLKKFPENFKPPYMKIKID